MEINKEELFLVYKEISAWPQNWNQRHWAIDYDKLREAGFHVAERYCGTAYCFAGHTVMRNGWTPQWDANGQARYATNPEIHVAESISYTARKILGLCEGDAAELFSPDNTIEMIREKIIELTGEDPAA